MPLRWGSPAYRMPKEGGDYGPRPFLLGEKVREPKVTHTLREQSYSPEDPTPPKMPNLYEFVLPDVSKELKDKEARDNTRIVTIDAQTLKKMKESGAVISGSGAGMYVEYTVVVGSMVITYYDRIPDFDMSTKSGNREYMEWLWLYDREQYWTQQKWVIQIRAQVKGDWERASEAYWAAYRAYVESLRQQAKRNRVRGW